MKIIIVKYYCHSGNYSLKQKKTKNKKNEKQKKRNKEVKKQKIKKIQKKTLFKSSLCNLLFYFLNSLVTSFNFLQILLLHNVNLTIEINSFIIFY